MCLPNINPNHTIYAVFLSIIMSESKTNATRMVLLAEDDEDDKEFISLAFSRVSSQHLLYIANNGQEVLEYLSGVPNRDYPCLIVLDLNMPVLNGLQTLDALKDREDLKGIPKVIFTTSDSDEDKKRCLQKGATDYLVKPSNMTEIEKTVEKMLHYCGA